MTDPEDPGGAGDHLSRVALSNEQPVSVDLEALARLARHALHELGVPPEAELSVLLVDEPRMAELKGQWLGEHAATDVLAFPMDDAPGEGPMLVGDVVLCPAFAARQAPDVNAELNLLLVHGILHLLGRDHADEAERVAMWAEQDRLLASFAGAAR